MAVTTTKTNKPINPRGDDKSPLAFNRAKIYSGKALDFDGVNDYVDAGTLDITAYTAWSVAFTFKVDVLSGTQIIYSLIHSSSDDIRILVTSSGAFQITFDDGTTDDVGILNPIELGKIYNVSISYDGTNVACYINGVQVSTGTASFDFSTASGDLYLGSRLGSGFFFDGEIYGFKQFNTALTAAQVLDLYNNPEKIVPTGVSNDALKLWLPMMEGAGTTAYDGSGNGNHGTISGATWTHGVGAPVAQTAVIDWNKGTNLLLQSNQFDTTWSLGGATLTSGQSGYDASSDAWLIQNTGNLLSYVFQSVSQSGVQTFSIYAKGGNVDWMRVNAIVSGSNANAYFDITNGTIGTSTAAVIDKTITPVGNSFYRISLSFNDTISQIRVQIADGDGDENTPLGSNIYIQDAQLESASTAGPYVLTFSTAQSSEVLIPQSLTSGRDLFYNSFENVRKQYALNLDGQSWAEVHDNESLDFGTGSFTLEAWVKAAYINTGSSYNVILNLGDVTGTSATIVSSSTSIHFFYGGEISHPTTNDGSWVHIVGTYDGTNVTLYINGVQVNQAARTAIDTTNDLVKTIGRDTTTTRNYKDQIAQPRIYNRALTADEVEQNYNAGKNTYS